MSLSLKPLSDKVNRKKINSLKNTALNKVANAMKGSDTPKVKKEKPPVGLESSSQESVPVIDIIDNIIVTTDKRYVSILEFTPVNFNQKNSEAQASIVRNFSQIFKNGPIKAAIHILSDRYCETSFIETLIENNKGEQDEERVKSLINYRRHIIEKSHSASLAKRFFFILQYEGDGTGKKSTDRDEIIEQLHQMEDMVRKQLERCGNAVITLKNRTRQTCETLYYILNRKTCRAQPFKERYERIETDFKKYNRATGLNKKPAYVDYLAPKGLYFDSPKYVFRDGQYYTYLGVKADGFPSRVFDGWCSGLSKGYSNIDTTIIFQKLPKEIVIKSLKFINRNKRSTFITKREKGDIEKAEKAGRAFNNNQSILNLLASGDDVYNVDIIFTIRGETEKEVEEIKREFVKSFDSALLFEDSYLCTEDYYKATLPFLYTPLFLTRLHHNVVSTYIGGMYPLISYEINDIDGVMIGNDLDHGSLVIANFFANRFANGHSVVIGKSGMGKSFTQMTIAGRASLNGMRVTCICPVKGFEYKGFCEIYGGTYVDLTPGSKDCVNPMDIRSEALVMTDNTTGTFNTPKAGLLAKKITTLVTWFKLNLFGSEYNNVNFTPKHISLMQSLLVDLYHSFGITDDDSSLYDGIGQKKKMPIIQDWYEAVLKDNELSEFAYVFNPYIKGSGKNLNGQTNVDLTKKVTVYDVDGEDKIPQELLAAYIYLAFTNAYDRIKEDITQRDLLVLDEVWKMMKTEECAKQVQNAILLMRSYYGCCMIATQELDHFFGKTGEFGKSIVNNATFKFFLGMNETVMRVFKENYRITEEEEEKILSFGKGEALFVAGNDKLTVKVSTTEREFTAFDTNGNTRGKLSAISDEI